MGVLLLCQGTVKDSGIAWVGVEMCGKRRKEVERKPFLCGRFYLYPRRGVSDSSARSQTGHQGVVFAK